MVSFRYDMPKMTTILKARIDLKSKMTLKRVRCEAAHPKRLTAFKRVLFGSKGRKGCLEKQ